MQTILPKQALDKIAQKFGFPEFVLGIENNGLIFELMWISWKEDAFEGFSGGWTVVIHSNHWIKAWVVYETSSRSSDTHYAYYGIDITKQGDAVLTYINEGHSFGSPVSLDGHTVFIDIFYKDKTNRIAIWNPTVEFDATSVELEKRLNELGEQIFFSPQGCLTVIISLPQLIPEIIRAILNRDNYDFP